MDMQIKAGWEGREEGRKEGGSKKGRTEGTRHEEGWGAANQPDTHFVFLAYILMQSRGLTGPGEGARARAGVITALNQGIFTKTLY